MALLWSCLPLAALKLQLEMDCGGFGLHALKPWGDNRCLGTAGCHCLLPFLLGNQGKLSGFFPEIWIFNFFFFFPK